MSDPYNKPRGPYQVIKCKYCRSEYKQEITDKSSKPSSICVKCEKLLKMTGKDPIPCQYCNIIAAFIGTKCQRCTNSEKVFGPPVACDNCRQNCAFDRKDPNTIGRLCWLCTMAYKRTCAKAKQKEALLKVGQTDKHHSSSSGHHHHHHHSNGHRHSSSSAGKSSQAAGSSSSHKLSSQRHNQHNSSSTSSNAKKQRLDLSSNSTDAYQLMSQTPNMDSTIISDLKAQVAEQKTKLQLREKEMVTKNQEIVDLKRIQRELRDKITSNQRQHETRISELQNKLIKMQKQMASMTKSTASNKTAPSTDFISL